MKKPPQIDEVIRGLRQRDGRRTKGIFLAMALGANFANQELDEPDPRIEALFLDLLAQAYQTPRKGRAPLRLVKKKTPKE